MIVRNIMRKPAISVPVSANISEVVSKMRKHGIGILPVTQDNKVVGVITDRDIVMRYLQNIDLPSQDKVASFMSDNVLVCEAAQPIKDAAALMADHQVRRLPVCEAEGRLVGMLSLDDIAEDYSEHLAGETLGEIVETR